MLTKNSLTTAVVSSFLPENCWEDNMLTKNSLTTAVVSSFLPEVLVHKISCTY